MQSQILYIYTKCYILRIWIVKTCCWKCRDIKRTNCKFKEIQDELRNDKKWSVFCDRIHIYFTLKRQRYRAVKLIIKKSQEIKIMYCKNILVK